MTTSNSASGRRRPRAGAIVCVADGNRRDAVARGADGADAARPDRDDDHRPRADRPARRRRRGRGGARPYGADGRLHARHRLVSAVAPLAAQAYRRAHAAAGPRLAARRAVGGADRRHPADGEPVLRRTDAAGRGPGPAHRTARRQLSARAGVVAGAGLDLHRAAQLHGRGEPAGAGAVDHVRRGAAQRPARLCADQRRVRPAAAGDLRRRSRHHDRLGRDVRRGGGGRASPCSPSASIRCSASWRGSTAR